MGFVRRMENVNNINSFKNSFESLDMNSWLLEKKPHPNAHQVTRIRYKEVNAKKSMNNRRKYIASLSKRLLE